MVGATTIISLAASTIPSRCTRRSRHISVLTRLRVKASLALMAPAHPSPLPVLPSSVMIPSSLTMQARRRSARRAPSFIVVIAIPAVAILPSAVLSSSPPIRTLRAPPLLFPASSLALPLRCHLILHLLEQLIEVALLLALRLLHIAPIAVIAAALPIFGRPLPLPLLPCCSRR